jgi:concanavalin A-like lectin/glucanase superfamily protein/thrombospondin type 3 repeat protein
MRLVGIATVAVLLATGSIFAQANTWKMYVTNQGTSDVSVFDQDGNFLYSMPLPSPESPRQVGVSPNGFLYLAAFNKGIVEYDRNDQLVRQFGAMPSAHGLAIGPDARIYLSGFDVQIYAPDGTLVNTIPIGGTALAVSPSGNLLAADNPGHAIHIADLDGNLIRSFSTGAGTYPRGVTADNQGFIYAARDIPNDVVVYDINGAPQVTISHPTLTDVYGVAFSPRRTILVADFGGNKVLEFTTTGALLSTLDHDLSGPMQIAFRVDTPVCPPTPQGPVSWWAAEGTAADTVDANDGVLRNGASFAPGISGQAFTFDGVDDLVQIPSNPSLNPTGSFSIDVWVFPRTLAEFNAIFAKWADGGDYIDQRSYSLSLWFDQRVEFAISDPANQRNQGFHQFRSPPGVVPLNQWSHLAVVYEQPTGTRRIYVNGAEVASRSDPPLTITQGIAPLTIGGNYFSTAYGFFDGRVDDARYWNRILGPAEIAEIHRAGMTGSTPDTDGDSVSDFCDNCPVTANTDQKDADGDGTGDSCDACPGDPLNDGDMDGICGDTDNCPSAANPAQMDTDGDGVGNACDACPFDAPDDPDHDGVCSSEDNCPLIPNGGQADTDGDQVGDACDNCRFAYNLTQQDTDHDAVGNSCDNCLLFPNPTQADLDRDQRGDVCDNCPAAANGFQDDTDADSVGDVCDNCVLMPNPDQADVNADFVGDVCDLNDGLILVRLTDDFTVEWQQESGFEAFNWYRGDLSVLKGSGLYTQDPNTTPLAGRECGLADAYTFDFSDPPVGKAVFFLVTGVHLGVEGSLGMNSSGADRPNANPCP